MNDIMRTIGYKPTYFQNEGEVSIMRQLGRNDYPRFHLHVKEATKAAKDIKENEKMLVFNLHLDQKKPSYSGSHAHGGEYDGKLVEEEVEKIRQLLNN